MVPGPGFGPCGFLSVWHCVYIWCSSFPNSAGGKRASVTYSARIILAWWCPWDVVPSPAASHSSAEAPQSQCWGHCCSSLLQKSWIMVHSPGRWSTMGGFFVRVQSLLFASLKPLNSAGSLRFSGIIEWYSHLPPPPKAGPRFLNQSYGPSPLPLKFFTRWLVWFLVNWAVLYEYLNPGDHSLILAWDPSQPLCPAFLSYPLDFWGRFTVAVCKDQTERNCDGHIL